jgi:ABC-type antimicrobial peptide transport system permease subunit
MELGANRGSVVWLVMREVLMLSAKGVAIGGAGAYAATRFVETQLFGILPTDALTMALSAVGIATVAILSGYFPARRATAIDPMHALRWE